MPEACPPPTWLRQALRADALRWSCLQLVRDQLGSGFWLAAGFIRNLAWDRLHGYPHATALQDIDVIYLDNRDTSCEAELRYQQQLCAKLAAPWQVRNQARMAVRNGHTRYLDCNEAIGYWPETATCFAVRLDVTERLHWLAPLGWEPLLTLQLHRNPAFTGGDAMWQRRLANKDWLQRWPQLRIAPVQK
ncbi:nucleotidyltransferase family protein [Vogesella oryzae]|uniref:nucleotidyltransferase family protein n=1 Tax=Vogesella oryzae TaxID=1735285 RepID=UPI001583284F|nr:nucleotidyltransferase family protein [Vogesella oryzae]